MYRSELQYVVLLFYFNLRYIFVFRFVTVKSGNLISLFSEIVSYLYVMSMTYDHCSPRSKVV